MQHQIPEDDLAQLEAHREEAQRYLPLTRDERVQAEQERIQIEMDAGTDPYTSIWLDVATGLLAAGTLISIAVLWAGEVGAS